jgi:outer membrane protein OmpA-like peptidoglycan-associated protein
LFDFVKSIERIELSNVSIDGYCDDIGSYYGNQILSNNRAKNIKQFLLTLNVECKLITEVIGKGEVTLLDTNFIPIKQQRTQNRRVEIVFTKHSGDKEIVKEGKKSFDETLKVGDVLIYKEIEFYSAIHKIREYSYPILDSLVKELKRNPQYDLLIMGYTTINHFSNEDFIDYQTGKKIYQKQEL